MNAFMSGLFAGLALNTPEGKKFLNVVEKKAESYIKTLSANVKDVMKASEIKEESQNDE